MRITATVLLLLAAVAGCEEAAAPPQPAEAVVEFEEIVATGTAGARPRASFTIYDLQSPRGREQARAVIEALRDIMPAEALTAPAILGERFLQINANCAPGPCARYVEFATREAEALWRNGNRHLTPSQVKRMREVFVTVPLSAVPQEFMEMLRSEGIEIAPVTVLGR